MILAVSPLKMIGIYVYIADVTSAKPGIWELHHDDVQTTSWFVG
jgi:hypothetical protein